MAERLNINGTEIIGIDHGYGHVKTRNYTVRSGITASDTKPYLNSDYILFEDRYYIVGEGHKAFSHVKSGDEDNHILTAMALAKELRTRDIKGDAQVIIAAGLPLLWYGNQKDSFKEYLMHGGRYRFTYKDETRTVNIKDVMLFPQGFAAIAPDIRSYKGMNVLIDVGNGTLSTIMIVNGRPIAERCHTDKFGAEVCIRKMREKILTETGYNAHYSYYDEFLKKGPEAVANEKHIRIMENAAQEYVNDLMSLLGEWEYDPDNMLYTFMGGGAQTVKKYLPDGLREKCRFIDDIRANAKGYEALALAQLKRGQR